MRTTRMRAGSLLLFVTLSSGAIVVFEACGGSDANIGATGSDGGNLPDSTTVTDSSSGGVGADTGSGEAGGDPDGGGSPDADAAPPGPDAASPIGCPAALPTPHSACPATAKNCTYGTSPRFDCHPSASCVDGGWEITTPACPVDTCPATPPSPDSGVCTVGDVCGYDSPATSCLCYQCSGLCTVPIKPASFHCTTPPAGCPVATPNLGTACNTDGVSCNYGACSGGIQVQCMNGAWTREFTACPGTVHPD